MGRNVEATKVLLQAGADPNPVDTKGSTPLHYATQNDNGGHCQHCLKPGPILTL